MTGHTDNTPIRTLRFPSNWELSKARAEAVSNSSAATFRLGVCAPRPWRLRARRGQRDRPGRAKNRRVEITLYVPASTGGRAERAQP